MKCQELFAKIDALDEKYIKMWEDVCNIESPTDYKAGVDSVGHYFIDLARKLGFTVETFPQSVSGDVVCITLNPDAAEAPITLSGHIDMFTR